MITWNQNMEKKQNYVYKDNYIYIDIAKNVKQDLILEIMNDKDHYQNEKIQNNWINERWI